MRHPLPDDIKDLLRARDRLRERYRALGLKFTLDGNLIGDLAEAVVIQLYGLRIAHRRGLKGIDAESSDGRTIQIKATGRGHSFAFTHCDPHADWLVAVVLHYEDGQFEIVYNGPYAPAVEKLEAGWRGQKQVPVNLLRRLDQLVDPGRRLQPPSALPT